VDLAGGKFRGRACRKADYLSRRLDEIADARVLRVDAREQAHGLKELPAKRFLDKQFLKYTPLYVNTD
jgi:hypothetical protein